MFHNIPLNYFQSYEMSWYSVYSPRLKRVYSPCNDDFHFEYLPLKYLHLEVVIIFHPRNNTGPTSSISIYSRHGHHIRLSLTRRHITRLLYILFKTKNKTQKNRKRKGPHQCSEVGAPFSSKEHGGKTSKQTPLLRVALNYFIPIHCSPSSILSSGPESASLVGNQRARYPLWWWALGIGEGKSEPPCPILETLMTRLRGQHGPLITLDSGAKRFRARKGRLQRNY